jgi:membrane-associated protease RseP (regulator of RpoE activity)
MTSENYGQVKGSGKLIQIYEDTPALKAGLFGPIVEFNGKRIRGLKDLDAETSKTIPGQIVIVKTLVNDSLRIYEVTLIEHPANSSKGYLGIATVNVQSMSFLKRLMGKVIFFKDPNTYYQPKFASDFIIFMYNLIWWIVLVCFSVGIMNMLPLGIFDGGRVFYLTILWITKSEKWAKRFYSGSTYFFILVFIALTVLWAIGIFLK